MTQGVTVLWALRSPCDLHCQYCYFGTLQEDFASSRAISPGQLSHVGATDVSASAIIDFLGRLRPGLVHRVFIAGGEPLRWRHIFPVVRTMKSHGLEVIVSTNGLPLTDARTSQTLLALGVDAVSVSLDSLDAEYNDHWRHDPRGIGTAGVVAGLRLFLQLRDRLAAMTKVGVYTVVSHQNISHIAPTAAYVEGCGVDYFVVQPISLAEEHKLHGELSLQIGDAALIRDVVDSLESLRQRLYLPSRSYIGRVLGAIERPHDRTVAGCFGGRDLFFIEPDGSVWDCPSRDKIQCAAAENRRSIVANTPEELFGESARSRNTDCTLFGVDCVNMWQLMAFDEILDR